MMGKDLKRQLVSNNEAMKQDHRIQAYISKRGELMSGFKDQNMNEVKAEGIESEIRVALSHIPYVYLIYDIVKDFVSVHNKKFRIVRAGSLDSFDYLGNDEVSS